MEDISLSKKAETDKEFIFSIQVGDSTPTNHEVTLKKEDYDRLAPRNVSAKELVKESFRFLLEREKKESILRSFDLTEITTYFPDYEERIKDRLSS